MQPAQRIWLTDVAALLGMPYITAWNHAQRGAFGELGREGHRIYVSRSGVDAFRALTETPEMHDSSGNSAPPYPDLTELQRRFRILGARRAALLDHLRAELTLARAHNDAVRAEVVEGMMEVLPGETYRRAPDGASWTVDTPGIGTWNSRTGAPE